MITLNSTRQDVIDALGAGLQQNIHNELLDEAIRGALHDLSAVLPGIEKTFTIVESGDEQDLTALAPRMIGLIACAYPWYDGASWMTQEQKVTPIGFGYYRFDDVSPQADELLRMRYKSLRQIKHLDEAAETDLEPIYRYTVAQMAAGKILSILALREEDAEKARQLGDAGKDMTDAAEDGAIDSGSGGSTYVSWSEVGFLP